MYFVYILRSTKDEKYYIDQTNDLQARLDLHNAGRVVSTKSRRPVVLIKSEIFNTRGEARKRENYLKKLKGDNEFKKFIKL